jgi:glucokinase
MALAIGVDIGGTKVAAGVVDETGRILARTRLPTPARDVDEVEDAVAKVVAELRGDHDAVVAVGVGAAGWVDAERSTVLFAPNLAWRDEPLRERVARRVELPVVVENDANAAAWAEHRFGAARGSDHVVALTVGTGIGGGLVLDGRLYRGRFGIAGEPGHLGLEAGGVRCGCGNDGCLEQYVSGTALERLARERALVDPAGAAGVLGRGSGDPVDIDGEHVTAAALDGDAWARGLFDVMGHYLGEAVADVVALLDPEVVVIGGGVSDAGDVLLQPTRAAFLGALTGREHRPHADLRLAALGNDAGLVGAADLARLAAD